MKALDKIIKDLKNKQEKLRDVSALTNSDSAKRSAEKEIDVIYEKLMALYSAKQTIDFIESKTHN